MEACYAHYEFLGRVQMRTGYCESTPEVQYNGRIRLFEKWHWTCGDREAGTSIVEEVVAMG